MEIWQASPDYDQRVQQLDEILTEVLLWGIIGIVFTAASLTCRGGFALATARA
jgi:hypothetical protein